MPIVWLLCRTEVSRSGNVRLCGFFDVLLKKAKIIWKYIKVFKVTDDNIKPSEDDGFDDYERVMEKMSGDVNSLTMDVAEKSLSVLWKRGNVISDNISNADTPNYKEKGVAFEDTLSNAISDGNLTESELSSAQPQIVTLAGNEDVNGNSVDIDSQMVELARNQLQYNYLSKAITTQFSLLSEAESSGK